MFYNSYLGIVHGVPTEATGMINASIARHPDIYQQFTSSESILHRAKKQGKTAITHYKLEATTLSKNVSIGCKTATSDEQYQHLSVLRLLIDTGRTHQIRVHLAEQLGCPIVGDVVYGKGFFKRIRRQQQLQMREVRHLLQQQMNQGRHLLHAHLLEIKHPVTGLRLSFQAPPPEHFSTILNEIMNSKI